MVTVAGTVNSDGLLLVRLIAVPPPSKGAALAVKLPVVEEPPETEGDTERHQKREAPNSRGLCRNGSRPPSFA